MPQQTLSRNPNGATHPGAIPGADAARRRWHAGQRITAGLLLVWFVVTFGVAYFARELSGIVAGWPLSFWVAAQGALLVYLLLVCLYAHWSNRLDGEHGFEEDD